MYELPVSVTVEGNLYHIRGNGDYRVVLDCFSALSDLEMDDESERVLTALYIFYDVDAIEDILACDDVAKLVSEMYNFFNGGRPDAEEERHLPKVIDWDTDSAMIFSAVNAVAGKEVRAENYIHWWTFMGYYMAIGESTLSTVVSIRDKIVRGKSLEKWERKFKNDNPQYFIWNSKSVEELEAEQLVLDMWNNKE